MKKLLSCLAIFTATYLLLSIEVGNRPLFERLYRLTAPLTTSTQRALSHLIGSGISGSRTMGQKLFQNSTPKLSTGIPSNKYTAPKAKSPSAPQEDIPEAERRELDELIKGFSN